MQLMWGIVGYALYVYLLVLLVRIVAEATRQFARSWRPAGMAAVGLGVVYALTDPPVRALRRLIRPVRMGMVSLDLSVLILILAILSLSWVAANLAQS